LLLFVLRRGISYDKLGAYEAAVEDFSQVIALEPGNSVAYFNRGTTFDSLGLHDQAIADFSKALELEPNNGDIGETTRVP
jgi:lipoprotein NlpI